MRHRLGKALARATKPVRTSPLLWRLSNRTSREGLLEFVDAEVMRLAQGPEIGLALQIGAGGELGARAARLPCRRLVQVDRDPRRGPDVVADARDLSGFEDGSVDVVFLLEVLEHVPDPQTAVDEIHRVLRKDGTLLLTTPFAFEIHDAPHDYHRFTRFGLAHLLRGFSRVEIRERSGPFTSALVPLVRLYKSPRGADAFVGLLVLLGATGLRPLVRLADRAVHSRDFPAGYVVRATR